MDEWPIMDMQTREKWCKMFPNLKFLVKTGGVDEKEIDFTKKMNFNEYFSALEKQNKENEEIFYMYSILENEHPFLDL